MVRTESNFWCDKRVCALDRGRLMDDPFFFYTEVEAMTGQWRLLKPRGRTKKQRDESPALFRLGELPI